MNNSNVVSNNIFDIEPKKTTNIFEMPVNNNQNKNNDNNIFSNLEKVEKEEEKLVEIEKDKKIERIQIALILILIIVGSLVYFFGYDFLKPFIKVD